MKKILPWLLLSLFAAQCLYFAWHTGQTTDETYYNGSGYAMLRYGNYRFLGEHPPLMIQLGTVPLLFLQPEFPIDDPVVHEGPGQEVNLSRTGAKFLYHMGNDPRTILFLERLPVILLAIVTGFFLYRWALALFGPGGALLSLTLYAFCPNILAHGSLFTTDFGVTAFYFLTIYALWKFFETPSQHRAAAAGILMGCALLSKMSALVLVPVLALLFLIGYFEDRTDASEASRAIKFPAWFYGLAFFLLMMSVGNKVAMPLLGPLCLAALSYAAFSALPVPQWIKRLWPFLLAAGWAAALLYSLKLFKKYEFMIAATLTGWVLFMLLLLIALKKFAVHAKAHAALQSFFLVIFAAALTVICSYTDFPYAVLRFKPFDHYIQTFNASIAHARSFHMQCIGSFVSCDWRYFPSLMLVKTPLLTLFLAAAGTGVMIRMRSLNYLSRASLLLPPVLFLIVAMFLNRVNIGLRHALPVYPFLFLTAGSLIPVLKAVKPAMVRKAGGGILTVLTLMLIARTWTVSPHYLSYFSEWVGGVDEGLKLVSDSNIEWGQDNKRLVDLVKREGIPSIRIDTSAANKDLYDFYGISWKPVNTVDLKNPPPGFYAISAEVMRYHLESHDSWFKHHSPKYKAGATFYVFEVP